MNYSSPINIATATREELKRYLENRGFAVYDDELIEVLREAAQIDMETRDTGAHPIPKEPG